MSGRRVDGYSIIELLVVVAIIAVLAAVAIPQYSVYKRRSVDRSVQSVLSIARQAMEAYYEDNGSTYEDVTLDELRTHGFRDSRQVDVVIVSATDSSYQIRACATGGSHPSFIYDADVGETVGDSGTCP